MQRIRYPWAVLLIPALLSVAPERGTAAELSPPPPPDPVAARAHLPMPWRIIGASFVSLEKGEAGWLPGLMGDGHYLVDFDEYDLVWRHADVEDHYACVLGKDGAFEAHNRTGDKAEGRVDLVHGTLVWRGEKYRVRTYEEIEAEKKEEPPAAKLNDPASPVRLLDNNTLEIDLRSEKRGSGGLSFAMGHLSADYLGHHRGWAILRVSTNIEMGRNVTLYRLPISDGTATIQAKNLPSYSFAEAQGKVVWGGVTPWFGDGIGWTATAEDREQPPAANNHYVVNANEPSRPYVFTTEMLPGVGAEVQPGARVEARLWFYTDKGYTMLRPGARQGEKMTFTVGPWKDEEIKTFRSDGVDKALDGMVRGMKAGGWRRAQMNQVAAQDLGTLVPRMKAREVIYIEVNLLAVESRAAGPG